MSSLRPPPQNASSAQQLLSSFEELTRALRQIERGKKTDGDDDRGENKTPAVDEQLEMFVERFSRSKAGPGAKQPAGTRGKNSRKQKGGRRLKRSRNEMTSSSTPLPSSSAGGAGGRRLSSSTRSEAVERMLGADLSLTSKSENALYGSLLRQRRGGAARGPSWKSATVDNAALQLRLHRAQQRGREGKKLIAAAAERHAAAQRTGYATAPRPRGMEEALQLVKETSGSSFLHSSLGMFRAN